MNVVRTVIESNYIGKCDIYEQQECFNEAERITEFNEILVYEAVLCRLSFNNNNIANETETSFKIKQGIVLFLAPEVEIKPGSKIVVSQNGKTTAYKSSGQPSIYATHQQVYLELLKEWA